MIVQYASDLHLEFPHNKKFLMENLLQPKGDVLLLAGDVVPFSVMEKHQDFFSYISDQFQTTWWIPGNHEYYYYDLADKCGVLHEKIRPNVNLVNNIAIRQDDVCFIFSTLWSKISPANEWDIENSLSDFLVIRYKERSFTVGQFNQMHEECLNFVTSELRRCNSHPSEKTVVVTHHVPTLLNYPEKFKGDLLNEAFAVELFDLIETTSPDYWIYGHHHNNFSGFSIGNTQMLTNQLGYVKYGEHALFNPEKTIVL